MATNYQERVDGILADREVQFVEPGTPAYNELVADGCMDFFNSLPPIMQMGAPFFNLGYESHSVDEGEVEVGIEM